MDADSAKAIEWLIFSPLQLVKLTLCSWCINEGQGGRVNDMTIQIIPSNN